ncbi:MAG: AAA domain-containing protein, partial [Alphaproteobacteria bacterium]|nr:AAA domain-containing protein [Alphaproteobacteria bacterium]
MAAAKAGVEKVILGQSEVVEESLITLLAGGHVLLIGVPGLAKTKLVQTLGAVLGLEDKRVQFTPDLMPADILGSEILEEGEDGKRFFRFVRGPVFSQLLMADEINRASPRTQSALLQAMQERRVSIAGQNHDLPQPFHVLATQNPIEQEGTYPLPEAQLDRFFLKLMVKYPSAQDLATILNRTTGVEEVAAQAVISGDRIMELRSLARQIPIAEDIQQYTINLVLGTHPDQPPATEMVQRYVRFGASPRGAQALIL